MSQNMYYNPTGFSRQQFADGVFSIPNGLWKNAKIVGANRFEGKRAWAVTKLRGWGQKDLGLEVIRNGTDIPNGFYIREMTSSEARHVADAWMPTFRPAGFGRNEPHMPEQGKWWRVFFVTTRCTVSRFYTEDDFAISSWQEEHWPFSTTSHVFRTLIKAARAADEHLKKEQKVIDIEPELEEAIQQRKELVHVRDMDRTSKAMGGIGTDLCSECGFFGGCKCGKCIRCCLQTDKCSLPKEIWEMSFKERVNHIPIVRGGRKQFDCGRKKFFRQWKQRRQDIQDIREFCSHGQAHSWLPKFETEHNMNFNVNLPFVAPLLEALKQVNEKVPWNIVMKDFFFLLAHLASGTKSSSAVAVIHFITQLPLAENLVSNLVGRARAWFTCNAQASGMDGLFVPLITMLGVVISTLGLGKLPADKSITDFIMRLSKIGSCIKSLETIKDYIQPTVETVIDYIRVNFFGYNSSNLDAWKSYEDYCDEIQQLNNSGFEERLKTEKELVIKIDDLLMRGDNLMKTLDQLRVPPTQRTRFNAAYAWLGRMRNEAAHCSAGKHIPRIPPVIFHIIGKTGVGKSEATTLLNARLLTALGHTDESDLYTKVYYRDCGQERFDGFNSGVVGVVVDDFGSRVDSESNPSSEPFEVIRMQNSAVWQLPMASLSEKGSTFFRAKYVVWTSNQSTFKFKSITNPEAVLRRVTLKFSQYPRPEFATVKIIGSEHVTTLDHFKVAEVAKTRPDVYEDVWLFDIIDPQEDASPADSATGGLKVLEKGLSFDQMAAKCEEALLRAQRVGQRKLDHTAEYFKKCVENKGKAQGCDWFGLFGKSGECRYEFEHLDLCDVTEDLWFEGKDVRPEAIPTTFHPERCEEHEKFRGKTCFRMKGGPKIRERFVRALLMAQAVEEQARIDGMTEEERIILYGKTVFSYNVPLTMIKDCEDCGISVKSKRKMEKIWKKVKDFVYENTWNRVPETWKPAIAVAFELAVACLLEFLCIFLVIVTGATIIKFFTWLFPSLDPDRKWRQDVYQEACWEADRYNDPPFDLLLLIERLEDELDIPEDKRRKTGQFDERKCYWMINAIRNAESHQDRTPGGRYRNVESFQERVNGTRQKNVESHQEKVAGAKPKNVETGPAESTNDQNAQEIARKVKRNIYGIMALDSNGSSHFMGNLLFVVGKIAITNRHILHLIRGREVRLFNQSSQRGIVLTKEQTEKLNASVIEEGIQDGKDVVMMEMPRHCIVHADIRPYFMTKQDFGSHRQIAAVGVFGYASDLILQNRYSDRCQAIDRVHFELIEGDGSQTLVRDWYRYGIHSAPGDCGSVAIAHDASTNRKIIGIHMAGYDSEGYYGVAVAVHQELLQKLRDGLTIVNAESDLDGTFAMEGEETDRSFGDFVNYGKASAKPGSAKTVIKPGPVHGLLAEPKTAPAILRPFWKDGKLVDPLEMSRVKADTPNVPVDQEILKQCSQHYSQLLKDLKIDDRDDKVLSWEEAIKGTDDPLYCAIKRQTSPGYGWDAPGKGKEPWLGSGENYITDHPEVIAKRDEMLERIHEGKRASTVFVDTLKDERRPLKRVAEGKTRLFAAGEMVFCLLFRQYFAGFNAHIMRNCVRAEATVGINPFGEMWTTLANKLREVGPHVVAGDFSNYDGTLCSAIMWEVLDVVESFYENATDEERKVRRALWCELVNSVHITTPFEGTQFGTTGYLYQWSHSQPSGNPMTVILNSVYHSIVARYVFKLCARKFCPEKVGLDSWDKYVRHVNYGDDDVTNVHPEIIGWFNQLTMTEAYKELGMEYTDEVKSGELISHRKLEDVSFLKRKFRWDVKQGRWRCPHSMDTILEMAMWVKRGANVYELTAEVLEEAVHELAQHTEAVFDSVMPLFWSARKKVIPYWDCTFLSYAEYAEIDMARLGWETSPDVRDLKELQNLF
nr:MAG: nonstructural polyprotein [Weivirus-like virus sp.]